MKKILVGIGIISVMGAGVFLSSNKIPACTSVTEDVLNIVNKIPFVKINNMKFSNIGNIQEKRYDSSLKTRYCTASALTEVDGIRRDIPVKYQIYQKDNEFIIQAELADE